MKGECVYMRDIDDQHDLSHMSKDEYEEKMRHIKQLSSCPCTHCTDRCWDGVSLSECKAYRRWWYRNSGLKYDDDED